MSKPDFCICKNKGADQLRGNREADQRLCFRYTDSTIPLEGCSVNTSSIRPNTTSKNLSDQFPEWTYNRLFIIRVIVYTIPASENPLFMRSLSCSSF